MSGCRIAVDVQKTNKIPMGRGFYDKYENVLNYVLKTKGKFDSYVQSEFLSIDLDKDGGLLNVEVALERNLWKVDLALKVPHEIPIKRLKFSDTRLNISGESYLTNEAKDLLLIRFADENHIKTYEIAENLLADVNVVSELAGIWIINLQDDYGFKSEMEYRRGAEVTE
ncbi:MAG: hypothetical protein KKH67_07945 [candidate division Zixibacteria bacterium]|nr:hypothetical protein [candidate division Zixibacteria bacterium]MBU1471767.1 hypothetical protein [candidate division Zixibacteria bacterium]